MLKWKQGFDGDLPQLMGEVKGIAARYGVKNVQELPPDGIAEVQALVADWQQHHKSSKFAAALNRIVKPLGLSMFEKTAKQMFGPVAGAAAHSLVKRAQNGDTSAKQAIGAALSDAAKGDPRAQKAVHALTAARAQIKAFGSESAECLLAGARATAGAAALQLDVQPLVDCVERGRRFAAQMQAALKAAHAAPRKTATAGELAIVRGLPRLSRTELVTAGCGCGPAQGAWLSTAGGQVFVPAAYQGTAGARAARMQTLLLTPRIHRQLKDAAKKEARGQLPLGTTRRWAERAVSGFESVHGGAQTLREWLGQEPSLNIALK